MRQVFHPVGTCTTEIVFEVREGVLEELSFAGGCRGNLEGLRRLAIGRPVRELEALLRGISCQNGTSCPDQLARALAASTRGGKAC
ncbi:MAG: TIGR03905 family TSCPD domain-containing protein [Bacteroidota bacterium]